MSLIQSIKLDQLEARKAGETRLAQTLTTVIGEADMIGFNDGKRESTDVEVISVLKKFHANATANAQLFNHRNPKSQETRQGFLKEVAVYEKYMPKQMTEEEISKAITSNYFLDGKLEDGWKPKFKGVVMKYFKDNFAGLYDGKVVSNVVDNLIGK